MVGRPRNSNVPVLALATLLLTGLVVLSQASPATATSTGPSALLEGTIRTEDRPDAAAFDAAGNSYLGGVFFGTHTFGTGPAAVEKTATGVGDAYVASYTPAGVLRWVRTYGGTESSWNGDDGIADVSIDPVSGDVLVAGTTIGAMTFPGSAKTLNGPDSAYSSFALRLSSSGTLTHVDVWEGSFNNGAFNFFATAIAAGPSGSANVIIYSGGYSRVEHLDSSGTQLWTKSIFPPPLSTLGGLEDVVFDATTGNLTAVGRYAGTLETRTRHDTAPWDETNPPISLPDLGGVTDLVLTLNNDGTILWARRIGSGSSTFGSQVAKAVAMPSGGVAVMGGFAGTMTVPRDMPGPAGPSVTSHGGDDAVVVRYAAVDGAIVSADAYGGTGDEWPTAIGLTSTGGYLVGGGLQNATSIATPNGPLVLPDNPSGDDVYNPNAAFVVATEADRSVQWAGAVWSDVIDNAIAGLGGDPSGAVQVVGLSWDNLELTTGTGRRIATGRDGFIARYRYGGFGGLGSRYVALPNPTRVLDTRDHPGALGPQQSLSLVLRGVGGVDGDATAVALNLTITGPTKATHLTLWPSGQPRPTASSINAAAGQTTANMVVAQIGDVAGVGGIDVFNNDGDAHVIIDVVGYFHPSNGDAYIGGAAPTRVLDTRNGPGPVGPKGTIDLTLLGNANIPADATAVALNLTITGPTAGTHLTVFPKGQTMPTASSLNANAGQTTANMVIATVGASGKISIYNNSGAAHVIVDVVGWFIPGQGPTLFPQAPVRALDTRTAPPGALTAPTARNLCFAGQFGLPATGTAAVVVNITAVGATAPTHITVWPAGQAKPNASTLNLVPGETKAGTTIATLGAAGCISLATNSGSTHVIVDLVGSLA